MAGLLLQREYLSHALAELALCWSATGTRYCQLAGPNMGCTCILQHMSSSKPVIFQLQQVMCRHLSCAVGRVVLADTSSCAMQGAPAASKTAEIVASAASRSPKVAAASAPALTCSLPIPRNVSTTPMQLNKKPLPPGHHPVMVVPGFVTSQLRRAEGPTCGMFMPWNR